MSEVSTLDDLRKLGSEMESASKVEEPQTMVDEVLENEATDTKTTEESIPEPKASEEEAEGGEIVEDAKPTSFTFERKFKAKDPDGNSREYEIPEYLAKAVGTEEQAKEIKELFEKAQGLDFVKGRFNDSRTKYQTLEQNYNTLNTRLNEAKTYYDKEDYDSLFKTLGIPEQKVLQWIVDKIEYNQLPPEEQRARMSQQQQTQHMQAREYQIQAQQQYAQDLVVQAKAESLATALSKSDISEFANAFDQRLGRQGAFRDEVITRAEIAWFTRKEEISADQAVQEVLKMYGGMTPSPNLAQSSQSQQTGAPPQAPPAETKVIPRIKGGSSSPAQALPSSIEDLKKIYNQKFRS